MAHATLLPFTSHFMLLTLIPVHLLREPILWAEAEQEVVRREGGLLPLHSNTGFDLDCSSCQVRFGQIDLAL